MSTDYPVQYVDSRYWSPQCKNFELIDWEKWYATNPEVPKVFDPPQRYKYEGSGFIPLWYWNRSWYCQPLAFILRSCCAAKPEMERISDKDGDVIFKKLLDPEKTSLDAPEEFKNNLLWTENNYAPETLINLGSWAWREQSEEGRVIGVGNINNDWTSDATCFAYVFTFFIRDRITTVQRSPDGKWYSLVTMSDPGPESSCKYVFIYVVQEGDAFETPDGKAIDHVKPGDLVRLTWNADNPYETDSSKLGYMYFPRRVASINSEGELVKNSPHFEDLIEAATRDPSPYCCQTCCYTCACCMNSSERFDFQVKHVSDRQTFKSSAVPPTGEFIDRRIGEGEDEFDDNPRKS